VQENKFPAQLSLALLEVSSGLHWNTNFDSANEVNFPGNFCLLERVAMENFFSGVIDSLLPQAS